jgi:probable phosphoglycerate mutase
MVLGELTNRYYMMRHGESIANRQGMIVSHPENALSKFGLTSKGTSEVLESAVKTRLAMDTVIYSSDYLRAQETAQALSGVVAANSEIVFDQRLRERNFGEFELKDDSCYEVVWAADEKGQDVNQWQVESVESVLQRALSLIGDIEASHQHATVLLVGHGDVLNILNTHFMGISARNHRMFAAMKNAEIRRLVANDSIRRIA